jgi:hypothetical protein
MLKQVLRFVFHFNSGPGGSGLWSWKPAKRLKIGMVNISEKIVEELLDSVMTVSLHSVLISGRECALKNVLLSENSFTSANGIKLLLNTVLV